jgi:hypothetical protein
MFKTHFNSLYVSVKEFILNENSTPVFDEPQQEIKYYRTIVDEFNTILFALENIKEELGENHTLYNEAINIIGQLNDTFEKYKNKSSVIRVYLDELESFKTKVSFSEKLYKFEQSLIATPLVKIDIDELQNILTYAKTYAANTNTFYYYANNPFNPDDELGVLIPIKYSFDTAENLLTSVYNYMYGLFNTYSDINKDAIEAMSTLESVISEKIHTFVDAYNTVNKNKFYPSFETTHDDFYKVVVEAETIFDQYSSSIIEMGVYRFTELTILFESVYNDSKVFIDEYKQNILYKEYIVGHEFDIKIEKLAEYINLLEDGSIKIDSAYVLTDVTLKSIVDEIIELSRDVKKKIVYTQKYNASGQPKTLEFEFYQTELFLTNIKEYYYSMMSENIYRYSTLEIDDYGDGSINDLKQSYQISLGKYNTFITQEVDHLNDFEYYAYYEAVVKFQENLKNTSSLFFSEAIKTSPSTYIDIMEKQHVVFLEQLEQDLLDIRAKRELVIVDVVDDNKIEAYKKLIFIESHLKDIENISDVASRYVFLGMNDYINDTLYQPWYSFFQTLKGYYNNSNYVKVLETYNNYYNDNIVNYNILYAFKKISESITEIFKNIDAASALYIDEHVNSGTRVGYDEIVNILEDLFGDETYKVVRNELFAELDSLYEFVISTKPNEHSFLINEKNLKKLYLDNQLMKLNYIRWYHNILEVHERYLMFDMNKLNDHEWYIEHKTFIDDFEQKDKLNTLILSQNKTLSSITKMIIDSSSDSNYQTVNLSTDVIKSVETYNISVAEDIKTYIDVINKLEQVEALVIIQHKQSELELLHTEQWVNIIEENNISPPDKVSYTEMETFTGSIPFTVGLEAKMEFETDANGKDIEVSYKWFIGSVVKEGNEISHTFYEEGVNNVRCEMIYANGDSTSRYLEFNLTGPRNSHIIKSELMKYAPLSESIKQPKITYQDPETGLLVTLAITVDGNIVDMIGEGSITVTETGDDLLVEKTGLVILGFEGTEFAGKPFDYSQIFDDDFEYPEESEFLFDFKASNPQGGTSTVDITNSKFTNLLAKIPDDIESVYEIDKASVFDSIGDNVSVAVGDKLIMKNVSDRYAIIEIQSITTLTTPEYGKDEYGKYDYEIGYSYFVNTSLNQYDRDEFKPESTDLVVPTLVFKTDVRELFNSLIDRLEKINELRSRLTNDIDTETYETILTEVASLEMENNSFYLFEELNKIKAKHSFLYQLVNEFENKFVVDFDDDIETISNTIEQYNIHIDSSKMFESYMYDVNAYDVKQNLVDLRVLVKLYKEQQIVLETLIDTYEYKHHDVDYFKNKLDDIELLDVSDFIDSSLSYSGMLVNLVNKLRDLLFKVKIIINFPIMSMGRHIVFSEVYYRLKQNLFTGKWIQDEEPDLFLMNKKLELKYGYEIDKVESGNHYNDFISDLVRTEKELFGRGLSPIEVRNISNYIQIIESKAIDEYDDFFMIPFWIDYIEKNV